MSKKVTIITKCPSCNSLLVRINDQLVCRNTECGATKNKKLLHFIKTMKIKGLGEKTVEKLEIDSIENIYTMLPTAVTEIMGEKIGVKLLKEIELSKVTTLDKLLPAFSITLIGTTAARKLAPFVADISNITFEICKKAGLGDKASQSLVDWVINKYPEFKALPIELVVVKQPTIQSQNIKVCMTGKLNDYASRALAATFLESKGITVVSGVSKTLDYLINEDGKSSSKLNKANSYDIPVVTIKQLIEELNK